MSIREGKFPSSMKIARVIPILKPTKLKTNPEGYRPISNLHTLEKIYEEHLKRQLIRYLMENQIIHQNHHRGMLKRSTNTAKSLIDWRINLGYEQDKTSVILSTDLSSAFEVIDHGTLLRKMEYYGIINSLS